MIAEHTSVSVTLSTWHNIKTHREKVPSGPLEENDVTLICFANLLLQVVVGWLKVQFISNTRDEEGRVAVDVPCKWFVHEFIPKYTRVVPFNK